MNDHVIDIITIAPAENIDVAREHSAGFLAHVRRPADPAKMLPLPCIDANGDTTHYICVMRGEKNWAARMERYTTKNADWMATTSYYRRDAASVLEEYNLTCPALAEMEASND